MQLCSGFNASFNQVSTISLDRGAHCCFAAPVGLLYRTGESSKHTASNILNYYLGIKICGIRLPLFMPSTMLFLGECLLLGCSGVVLFFSSENPRPLREKRLQNVQRLCNQNFSRYILTIVFLVNALFFRFNSSAVFDFVVPLCDCFQVDNS